MMRHSSVVAAVLLLALAGCRKTHTPEQSSSTVASKPPKATASTTDGNARVAEPAPWLLTYAGKSSQDLDGDRRFPAFLRTHVSNKPVDYWVSGASVPSKDVREFLSGLADDVQVTDNRYVAASGCPAHDCTETALLWSDTVTGATVYAASLSEHSTAPHGYAARMWIFTNTPLTAGAMPPPLVAAIGKFTQQSGDPDADTIVDSVTVVQPDGAQSKLTPADVHAWQPGMPTRPVQ